MKRLILALCFVGLFAVCQPADAGMFRRTTPRLSTWLSRFGRSTATRPAMRFRAPPVPRPQQTPNFLLLPKERSKCSGGACNVR